MSDFKGLCIVTIVVLGILLTVALVIWALWWVGVGVSNLFHLAYAIYPPLVVPLTIGGVAGTLGAIALVAK